MTIRPARSSDEPWLRQLLFSALQEEYGPQEPGDLADEWQARIRYKDRLIWIAEIDGQPAGFLWVLRLPDPLFAAGDYYIYYVAVAPEARRRGLATALLQHARAALPGTLRLLVRRDSPARTLYAKLGARAEREEWQWPK